MLHRVRDKRLVLEKLKKRYWQIQGWYFIYKQEKRADKMDKCLKLMKEISRKIISGKY